MKSQRIILATLTIGAVTLAGLSEAVAQTTPKPSVVLTPPAVPNGSNWSRAPFPAKRQFDDTKPADGVAIDHTLPPNTPATNNEQPGSGGRMAVAAPAPAPAPVAVAVAPAPAVIVATEPALQPTGRGSVTVASSLDATTFGPTLRSATYANRNQVIADIESRVSATDTALGTVRGTANAMSADGKRAFHTAEDTVKQKAKALKKSIQAARKASESEWENARAQLASDFDAYAAAIASVDSTVTTR